MDQEGRDPEERIVRMGKEDNFWEHGPGACGPCSEIYFDRGPNTAQGPRIAKSAVNATAMWNFGMLSFHSLTVTGRELYPPGAIWNIDTGMGLERLACIMQGCGQPVFGRYGAEYYAACFPDFRVEYGAGEKSDISLRVITDHIRVPLYDRRRRDAVEPGPWLLCCAVCCGVRLAWAAVVRSSVGS